MIQSRKNVFETNSSSTHSLVMAMDSDFEKWEKGEVYYSDWFPYKADKSLKKKDSNFYTEEEAKAICKSAGIEWESEDEDDYCERKDYFVTYDEFCDTDYLEVEGYSFTTPSGEVVRAVAKYGYDG